MSADSAQPVPPQEVWFRRTFSVPPGATDAKAVLVGDDTAGLEIDGRPANCLSTQSVEAVDLDSMLKPGEHKALFKVVNARGTGWLAGADSVEECPEPGGDRSHERQLGMFQRQGNYLGKSLACRRSGTGLD